MVEQAVKAAVEQKYKYGFVSDIESDSLPPGLNEAVIRAISQKRTNQNSCSSGVWRLIATF